MRTVASAGVVTHAQPPPAGPRRRPALARQWRAVLRGAAVLAAIAGVWASAPPDEPGAALDTFLREHFRFTSAQLAAMRRGEPVAVDLPSTVPREVAVGGAVHIDAPAARTVEMMRDIERLESGEGFLATRKISDPPRLEDFDTLRLPAEDVDDLRTCRPGKCNVKLGQGAFDLLKTIDWKAPDAADQVTALARQTALDYVLAYRKGGNGELAVYRDTDRPQFIAQEFDQLVQRVRDLPGPVSDVAEYLVRYPAVVPAPGVEDFFYWSLADFGLKPVVRINHVVIYPVPGVPARYAIATKQLYASHYFHTALELRSVIDDPAQPGRAQYLVVLNAARSDGLTGMFGGMVKAKVRSGSRDGLKKALAAIKRRCEQPL